jgi:hypothetical protein
MTKKRQYAQNKPTSEIAAINSIFIYSYLLAVKGTWLSAIPIKYYFVFPILLHFDSAFGAGNSKVGGSNLPHKYIRSFFTPAKWTRFQSIQFHTLYSFLCVFLFLLLSAGNFGRLYLPRSLQGSVLYSTLLIEPSAFRLTKIVPDFLPPILTFFLSLMSGQKFDNLVSSSCGSSSGGFCGSYSE